MCKNSDVPKVDPIRVPANVSIARCSSPRQCSRVACTCLTIGQSLTGSHDNLTERRSKPASWPRSRVDIASEIGLGTIKDIKTAQEWLKGCFECRQSLHQHISLCSHPAELAILRLGHCKVQDVKQDMGGVARALCRSKFGVDQVL